MIRARVRELLIVVVFSVSFYLASFPLFKTQMIRENKIRWYNHVTREWIRKGGSLRA